MNYAKKIILSGYLLIVLLIVVLAYIWHYEWQEIATLEANNQQIDGFRKEVNRIHIRLIEFSLLGETVLDWDETDLDNYHTQRIALDSTLYLFNKIHSIEYIDSVRYLLEEKERQVFQIVRLMDEQQSINKKIANQSPIIVQKIVQEQPKKPKRKGFLGIFGKKEEMKPTTTTTTLRSPNRNMVGEQKEHSRRLSEQADSLAARNADLNRQLKGLICQIEDKVQVDLQSREDEIIAMREKSFMQVGGLMGFVLLLLLFSYIIIHRDAKSIKQYKRKTMDLIGQLEQSVQRNEVLIASRKKAVHTITHELRTPLTAITGYAELLQKECNKGSNGHFIRNIQQSSDRMRDMLNTLLDFFRLDNGKEQPRLSPCRISAITHTLETEFMPIAVNKGLSLTVKNGNDAVVLTDKERIIQIGNNLLSNAIKFTDEGNVSLNTNYTNGVLTLVVEDTGTGMTEEEQQQAFGAFERLSNAAAKDGFGLGLAIVKNIVTMLSGKIHLESEKWKRSCFTVEIPMSKAEEVPEQTIHDYIHPKERNLNVVAIDNDEVLLLMLKEMYAQEGIHCDTCTDTAELMEMIRRKEYNLLLTDLNMPDINGFELLELLRSSNVGNSQTIPVVVATASGSCDAEELLERGFAGYLFKPFSISELMEVSDRCAMKVTSDGKPDFSALLSYGNEVIMLERLITETEKEMQAVQDAATRNDLQELDALTHHLRSSWEILRADQPLRKLYGMLHGKDKPDTEALGNAVTAVLEKGAEIIRLAEEERKKYENG
ncbi:ATP-binding protein [Phocaeicola vulgatus]|uniref:ATP-binding protein n=1 Tax=Phocaeicola vulgatus TaxID=821 RepID=UPI0019237AF3|nr:ATP-binding protein [Phocaeicola vulgatus]MDB1000424.1 ATP-binding protein [Phocaeicola vulgatus]MDB1004974.1 ATP-binding protein [Phocaeicola vulgatus]MDC1601881.1 ATP-binding protein [Phocaeicola vulgatus]MDC1606453.1 ATP-binding protein [Phocaeicola vulgatus]MDC1615834.1 ATP-binding protein [Phocaeicola vulgatus]